MLRFRYIVCKEVFGYNRPHGKLFTFFSSSLPRRICLFGVCWSKRSTFRVLVRFGIAALTVHSDAKLVPPASVLTQEQFLSQDRSR